jgi:hypothetical protein
MSPFLSISKPVPSASVCCCDGGEPNGKTDDPPPDDPSWTVMSTTPGASFA